MTSRKKEKSSHKMSEKATDNKFFPKEETYFHSLSIINKKISHLGPKRTNS